MSIPTDKEILRLLDRLEDETVDDLESYWLDFKPWRDPRVDMRLAAEMAVCFAIAEGGDAVLGVANRIQGRAHAIHGADVDA